MARGFCPLFLGRNGKKEVLGDSFAERNGKGGDICSIFLGKMGILTEGSQLALMISAIRQVHKLNQCELFCAFGNSNKYLCSPERLLTCYASYH